jgi:hypothetical protein
MSVILNLRQQPLPEDRSITDAAEVVNSSRPTRATGPLKVHTLNPRYFTDGSGKAIYLTGSHTWSNLQDRGPTDPPPAFDYSGYLQWLQDMNHNFMRMWVWENAKWAPWTTGDYFVDPMPYQRTGPGIALDGKPKFDLRRFNQRYFDRLRERVIAAGDRGIYVAVMLFQGWSYRKLDKPGDPWRGHPFHIDNNVNGINGNPNGDRYGWEVHSLELPEITALHKAYVHKVIDTLNDLDNVLYEITNESNPGSVAWQYHIIEIIRAYEANKPKQHPILMSTLEDGAHHDRMASSPADATSPVGPAATNPPAANGPRVIISDTDHIFGIGGDHHWVWMSFTRGYNPIYMDPIMDPEWGSRSPNKRPKIESARRAMGDTLRYAVRTNLAAMAPRGDLCSTRYCLANPGNEYIAYLPFGSHWMEPWIEATPYPLEGWIRDLNLFKRSATLDLSASTKVFNVEWFDPKSGRTTAGGKVPGGTHRTLTAPFKGDAVLYLYSH